MSIAHGYKNAFAITKSDTVDQPPMEAIYVGGAGDVAVRMPGSTTTVTFTAPPVGTVLPIKAQKVMAATTATLLVGLWGS
jgi:hypothetical protein